MIAWLSPTLLALCLVSLLLLTWWVRQQAKLLHDLVAPLGPELQQMHATLTAYLAALHDRERREAKEKAELFVGAFLPTDQSAAQLEAQLKAAEDHAISAAGPIRFSSMPTGRSASGSSARGSTPPVRTSGARSSR
jgi:hypothetical protein